MFEFTISWIIITLLLISTFYFFSKVHFFKTLFLKTKIKNTELKEKNIHDGIILEIYETEINKNISSLEYLQDELVQAHLVIKELKNKSARLNNELMEAEEKNKTMRSKLNMLF